MSRKLELISLIIVDALAVNVAYSLQYYARFVREWFGTPEVYPLAVVPAAIVLAVFWLILFLFFGLYRERYADSRFDEIVSIMKVVTVGSLVLVFGKYIDALSQESARAAIFFYWFVVLAAVAVGRTVFRSVQKYLILRGYGLHNTLIVGWTDLVEQLHEEIARYPEAGLNVVGAVRLDTPHGYGEGDGADTSETPVLVRREARVSTVGQSAIESLPMLIDELGIQDVLIALGSNDHEALMDVLRVCDGKPVVLKLVPDFYSVIGGMARTEHMYGLPLIEVLPSPMPAWEQSTKRIFDIVVSASVLIIGLPLWIAVGVLIRLTSTGPAIYRQARVGQHGKVFTMHKFRTMRQDAEAGTGPVWASENDPRYTPIGRRLRRMRLDEVPQLINVLKGDMSLVGPRPERPYFVETLSGEIPLYRRRHRVKPGITGWAQVKWGYDASLADVRQKVKYDFFYIENMSLRMDFKILLRTLRTAVRGEGR